MTPQRQLTYLRTLGLMFCLAGGTLIAFGWHGAAKRACVDCQVPYLISGGVGGLALVVLGVALLVVASIRAEGATLARLLEAMAAPKAGPVAVQGDASGLVLAGGSTYHRPTCRLVKGRDDLPTRTVEMAQADGLVPCRVCWDTDGTATPDEPAGAAGRVGD